MSERQSTYETTACAACSSLARGHPGVAVRMHGAISTAGADTGCFRSNTIRTCHATEAGRGSSLLVSRNACVSRRAREPLWYSLGTGATDFFRHSGASLLCTKCHDEAGNLSISPYGRRLPRREYHQDPLDCGQSPSFRSAPDRRDESVPSWKNVPSDDRWRGRDSPYCGRPQPRLLAPAI